MREQKDEKKNILYYISIINNANINNKCNINY